MGGSMVIGDISRLKQVSSGKTNPSEKKVGKLHLAVRNGNIDVVNALIARGVNVNAVDEYGYTPLYLAVQNGYTEIVKALIAGKANVDAMDKTYKYTPLYWAARNGYIEIVKVLIAGKASVNTANKYGYTPLHEAAQNGYIEIVGILILGKADVNTADEYGYTPLHGATQNGHIDVVNALIAGKANVNVVDAHGCTPLYLAAKHGNAEIVKALIEKGADPLLGNKDHIDLKRLIEVIKNNSSEHPKKAEETQQREEQVDNEYEFLKYSLLFRNGCPLIGNVRRDAFYSLLCTWFAYTSDLTPKQRELDKKLLSVLKLDKELLSIIKGFSCSGDRDKDTLRDFLLKNKDDDDLKYILNLTRGESKLTILHVVSSMDSKLAEEYVDLLLGGGANPNIKDDKGKIPLHYASYNNIGSLIKAGADPNMEDNEERTPLHSAAGVGDEKSVSTLLEHGANSNKKNKQGKIPLQVAIDNHNYHVEECFLTDNQERLWKELSLIVKSSFSNTGFTELKEFLSKYENTPDLKRILNLRDHKGKSKILLLTKAPYYEPSHEKVERLLLEAGAIDYKGLDRKEHLPKSGTLWDNLILNQQKKLKMFLDVVGKAQDMNQLEQIVNKAIESGVRFNFLIHLGEVMYQDTFNFTDCVMQKISILKKSSKVENDIEVASGIVCRLVSKGAGLYNWSSIGVLDTLKSEFKDHTTNMKKANESYLNLTQKFVQIAKSAATGRVKDAKMDNSTFYLEYSEESTIDVAKITDGARDLGLTQGEIKYGRDIIKIGKSEVEIITANGIRHYTDLAEVSNKEEILEKFKNCKEELGKNCLLGGYLVYNAIELGYFERSGKLCQPSETMSSPVQQSHGYELKVAQPTKQQLLQDLRNVESNVIKKEKDFDTKTHLIDIFKILYKLLGDKENVSRTDLANVAEKESKRLGLEGRYNWNELFGLEKAVSQNIEQEGSSLPLSSDLYRQDKLASSVNDKVEKCTTEGDGNCFFHAVFGDNSSDVYRADRAQDMRMEWHKFLSQFESLDDPTMPGALKERLLLVLHNVFPTEGLHFCTSNLYKRYLNEISKQDYFVYVEEVPILASLANIEVEIHYTQKLPNKIKPDPSMINANYKRNQELWGSKEKETIYLESKHYSRAKVMAQSQKQMQEQRNVPCSNLLSCSAEEAKFNQRRSPQQKHWAVKEGVKAPVKPINPNLIENGRSVEKWAR
ncbi:hypothetical protein JTE90_010365 [Oedothorax gibbosus]|uniref:OTU domain-containing protein n=1 Tax=Oedothorax gibbosus TaxID=931172 RepID=A0AAV6TN97_9ARAC|nr:hypothetical protein JTE90_010365 [Oedothorax gibbosus]